MSNKLFVGNLSWNVNTDEMREIFSKYGNVVDCIVMTDRDTGRSRGFGFVTFETDEEAQAAIDALNETEIDGRQVTVNIAKAKAKF